MTKRRYVMGWDENGLLQQWKKPADFSDPLTPLSLVPPLCSLLWT